MKLKTKNQKLKIAAAMLLVLLTCGPVSALVDLSDVCLVQWKCNETSGTTAADSSGNGLNGTSANNTSGMTTADGRIGNALTFNGTSDAVSAFTSSGLNVSPSYSASIWFKTASAGNGTLFFLMEGENNTQLMLMLENGTVKYYATGLTHTLTAAGDYNDDAWHLAVVTHTGSTATVYIDNVQCATGEVDMLDWDADEFSIGNGDGGYVAATLDNFCLFSRVLTSAEIRFLYKNGAGTEELVETEEVTTDIGFFFWARGRYEDSGMRGRYE